MFGQSVLAPDCAQTARTPGASNPIAAPYFICASCQLWIAHTESIQRCRCFAAQATK